MSDLVECMKKIWIVLCLALLLLVGCGDEQVSPGAETTLPSEAETTLSPETETPAPVSCNIIENGVCRFKVVRPENATDLMVESAKAIYNALSKHAEGNVELVTDWIKSGTEYDSDAFEILVGKTGHPEAEEALKQVGYNQYGLIVVGNKLCLVGLSTEAVQSAANKLVNIINNRVEKGEAGTNLTIDGMYLTATDMKGCDFDLPVFDGAEFAGTYDCGDSTYKAFFLDVNETEFTAYWNLLVSDGAAESARRKLGENTFIDAKWGKWNVNVSFYPSLGEVGIAFSQKLKDPPVIAKEEYTPVQPLLTQFNNNEVGGGMGYLVRLEDSTFIIVDGGMSPTGYKEAYTLYELMKEQNTRTDGKLIVRAWFITHAHADHYNVLREFASAYGSRVKVESLLYSPMATLYQSMTDAPNAWDARKVTSQFPGCVYVKLMAGQVLEYPGCTFEVLYTANDAYMLESMTVLNDSSAVARIHIAGQTFMVLGDLQTTGAPRVAQAWGDYLKSDIMQMAHHGYYGGSIELYDYIRPSVILWPASSSFFAQHRSISINQTLLKRDYIEETILSGAGKKTLALPYTP